MFRFTAAVIVGLYGAASSQEFSAIADELLMHHGASVCSPMKKLDPLPGLYPWNHEPTCLSLSNTQNGSSSQSFCLYTKADFGSKRGISFITTPELAADVALSALSESSRPKKRLLIANATTVSYEAREMPGRGVGLFATEPREAGQVILVDTPTIITARAALNTLTRKERQELHWRGLLQLPEATRKSVRNLAKSRGGDEIDDIFQTNSIGLSLGNDVSHLGVMPEAARVNHNCRPKFDRDSLTLQVFALRKIEPGEEISFAYSLSEATHKARRHYLTTHWGFNCTCSACTASTESIAASDKRLQHIAMARARLASVSTQPKQLLDTINTLLELFDQEGLIAPKVKFYEIAAYAASQLGDEDEARRYGELARSHWRIIAGPDSWEVRRVEGLLKDPQRHPSWATKIKQTVNP